jgi:hypothetical protein
MALEVPSHEVAITIISPKEADSTKVPAEDLPSSPPCLLTQAQ